MKKLRIKWGNSYYQKRRYLIIRKNVVSLFIDIAKFGMLFILIYFLINNKMELTIVLLLISYYGRIRKTLDNIISFYISLAEKLNVLKILLIIKITLAILTVFIKRM